jgi:hypothetical protein
LFSDAVLYQHMVHPPVFAHTHPLVRMIATIASTFLPSDMSLSFQSVSRSEGDLFSLP